MLGTLVPSGGGAPIPLAKATVIIGRSPDCDIVVPCKTVSGRHCELRFQENSWSIRDLESKNGVTVNGVRRLQQRLSPNDALAIGRQRYVITFAGGAAQPPAAVDDLDVEALALEMFASDDPPPVAARPDLATPARSQAEVRHDPPSMMQQLHTRSALGKLVPCGGGDAIPLVRTELVIGRHPTCDVCLQLPAISAKHCRMSWRDGYWFVEDLNSTNGTWVNGIRSQKKFLLPDSVLGLARHRYTADYTATGTAPPPEEEDIFAQSLLEKAGLARTFGGPKPSGPTPDEEADPDRPVRYRLE